MVVRDQAYQIRNLLEHDLGRGHPRRPGEGQWNGKDGICEGLRAVTEQQDQPLYDDLLSPLLLIYCFTQQYNNCGLENKTSMLEKEHRRIQARISTKYIVCDAEK